MKNKTISLCLLLAMVMSMTALFALPASAENTYVMDSGAGVVAPADKLWTGTAATSFAGGLGTKEDPFQISNGEELKYLMLLNDSISGTTQYLVSTKGEGAVTPTLVDLSTVDTSALNAVTYYRGKADSGFASYDYALVQIEGETYLYSSGLNANYAYKVTELYHSAAEGTQSKFTRYVASVVENGREVDELVVYTKGKPTSSGSASGASIKEAYVYNQASGQFELLTVGGETVYVFNNYNRLKLIYAIDGKNYTTHLQELKATALDTYAECSYINEAGEETSLVLFTDSIYQDLFGVASSYVYPYEHEGDICYFTMQAGVAHTRQPVDSYTQDDNGNFSITFKEKQIGIAYCDDTEYALTDDIYLNDPAASFATTNDNLKQGKNIDTKVAKIWVPTTKAFKGVLDGKSHTIYGVFNKDYDAKRVGLFSYTDTCVLKNINIAYSAVGNFGGASSGRNAGLFIAAAGKETVMINCHAYNCGVYGNNYVGGLTSAYGNYSQFISCTFTGCVGDYGARTDGNGMVGGLVGTSGGNAYVVVKNCAIYGEIVNKNTGAKATTGGVVCNIPINAGIYIIDTANYANITATMHAAGLVDRNGKCSSSTNHAISIINCVNYGDVTSTAGHAGGAMAEYAETSSYSRLRIFNFANYGTITTSGTDCAAGGVIGNYATTNKPGYLYNILSLGEVQVGEGAEGAVAGDLIGKLVENPALSMANTYANGILTQYDTTSESGVVVHENVTIQEAMQVLNSELAAPDTWMQMFRSTFGATITTPQTFYMLPWVNGTGTLTAASLTLSDSLAINLYATEDENRPTFAFLPGLYVDDGSLAGIQLKAETEKVNKGGVDYLHFVVDDITPASIDKTFDFYLPHAQETAALTYSVLDYATRKYNSNSTEGLNELLEAIVHYGNAAQAAKGVTPTVLDTFAAETGYAYEGDYIADKYADVHFMNNESTFPEGVAVSLALTDGITPVIYVNNSDITHISYTCYEETTEQDIAGETYVSLDKLVATSLNNPVTITFTVAGEEVTGTWNVADFIVAATEANGFTAEQVTLAHALAVYMTAARAYKGLKN